MKILLPFNIFEEFSFINFSCLSIMYLLWNYSKKYSSTASLLLPYICEINFFFYVPQTSQFCSQAHHWIFAWWRFYFFIKILIKLFFHTSMFKCIVYHVQFFSRLSTTFVQWFTIKITNCSLHSRVMEYRLP